MQDIMMQMMRVERLMRRKPKGEHVPRGVSHLNSILLQNESILTSELCELMDIRPSSLNEVLSHLEADGLIQRRRSEEDKRSWTVSLTEKGKTKAQEHEAKHLEFKEKLDSILSNEERETLSQLLSKYADGLEELLPKNEEGEPHRHGHGPHHRPPHRHH